MYHFRSYGDGVRFRSWDCQLSLRRKNVNQLDRIENGSLAPKSTPPCVLFEPQSMYDYHPYRALQVELFAPVETCIAYAKF